MKTFGLKRVSIDGKERLNWLLEFIQCNLEGIDYMDRLRYTSNLFLYLYSRKLTPLPQKQDLQYSLLKDKKADGVLHEMIGEYFTEDICTPDNITSDEFWEKIEDIQGVVRKLFDMYLLPFITDNKTRIALPIKKEVTYFLEKSIKGNLEIKIYFTTQDVDDYYSQFPLEYPIESARSSFFEILNHVPISHIRKCADHKCGKWFLAMGERGKKKEFCNRKCMFRCLQEKHRQKVKSQESPESSS